METCLAPAKINLFLRIAARRDDGYHSIETLFQRIGLCDKLTVEPMPEGGEPVHLEIRGTGLESVNLRDNLVFRAWEKLAARFPGQIGRVRMTLEKNIPPGGGLGGGSSDAAAALLALRKLFHPPMEDAVLHQMAAELGADVPFFLGPPAAVGRGIGEILTPVKHRARFWAALAFPAFGVSTAAVYRQYNPAAPGEKGDLPELLRALETGDLDAVLALLFNGMEPLAFSLEPELDFLRERLEVLAGQPVRMSGSGSTFFTLCATEEDGGLIARKWERGAPCNTKVAPFL